LDKLGINLNLLIVQILHFVLLLWILKALLYDKILALFDQRRERILQSMEEANRVREAATTERATLEAQIAEERRTSQDRLREAVSRSEEAAERRLVEARAEAEKIVASARAEAEQTRAQALSGLQGQIADLALAAAGKVLGEGIDEGKHRSLVDRFLKEQLGDLA
jgi:F-type H+-transporting ATPase subunit b